MSNLEKAGDLSHMSLSRRDGAEDSLSKVLRAVQLHGALYLDADFRAPWCVEAPHGVPKNIARSADNTIFFYCLIEGTCRTRLKNNSETLDLVEGDLIVFPNDSRHLLGSDLAIEPKETSSFVLATTPHDEIVQIRQMGTGAVSRIVCGYLSCNQRVSAPLLSALPQMFRLSLGSDTSSKWRLDLVDDSIVGGAGATSILTKLSELIFAQALRSHAESLPDHATGWLAGLRDPMVGRALLLIHHSPVGGLTVNSIARQIGSSRSALTERFFRLIGEPPMQYLTQYRLGCAAHMLRATRKPISSIAESAGYSTECAFRRAFKRAYGFAPGAWRANQSMQD